MKRFIISFFGLTLVMPWTLVAWAAPFTPEKEQELGRRFHLKISSADILMDDPAVNDYYRSITDRIMEGAGLDKSLYNFYIVNIENINTFAVPGGYFYMNTGTIINLENEGQLAFVLAHDVAHVISRDQVRRIETAAPSLNMDYLFPWLVGALLANQGGSDSFMVHHTIFGGRAAFPSMLENSRDEEAEADSKALQYITKAGYNPRDMHDACRIMANKSYQVGRGIPTYQTIHPGLTSRLATTFKEFENSPPSTPDLKYLAFRDRVMALVGEPRRVQSVMAKRLNSDKNDHSAIHALGLLAARQQSLAHADKLMNRALILDPDNWEYLADLGDVALRRGQPAEAKKYFEKAGADNRQAVLGLARASELLDDHSQAATLYDQAVDMASTPYPEALEMAGRFFSQIGQEAKGNYCLARYFTSRGNADQAVFHYRQAATGPGSEQYKAIANREIDILTELKDN